MNRNGRRTGTCRHLIWRFWGGRRREPWQGGASDVALFDGLASINLCGVIWRSLDARWATEEGKHVILEVTLSRGGMARKILCVAEKPSIARAVAQHLGGGEVTTVC